MWGQERNVSVCNDCNIRWGCCSFADTFRKFNHLAFRANLNGLHIRSTKQCAMPSRTMKPSLFFTSCTFLSLVHSALWHAMGQVVWNVSMRLKQRAHPTLASSPPDSSMYMPALPVESFRWFQDSARFRFCWMPERGVHPLQGAFQAKK